jgi:endonuclease-3
MRKKERYEAILNWFEDSMPVAETELQYKTPFELLVAVVLSAQCTDKRVNMVTPALFEKYRNANELSKASFEDVFALIRSISYPNNKARHLIGLGQKLMSDFHGEVPMKVEDLIQLPGVGRKTANVITSVIDQQPNMAVDTHVLRVSARLGLTKSGSTPLATEKELIRHIPRNLIHKAHHWLILHGRYICKAQNPQCAQCGLQFACKFYLKNDRNQ